MRSSPITHLIRRVVPEVDPWASWDWAEAVGGGGGVPPDSEPTTLDELRVAHNVAAARGNGERAAELRRRLIEGVGGPNGTHFTDEVELLAVGVERGAATVVTLLWEAGPRFHAVNDTTFTVRCRVTERPPLWPAPVQGLEKDMAPPMTLKPSVWRPGYLYFQRFVALHGFGTQRNAAAPSFRLRHSPVSPRYDSSSCSRSATPPGEASLAPIEPPGPAMIQQVERRVDGEARIGRGRGAHEEPVEVLAARGDVEHRGLPLEAVGGNGGTSRGSVVRNRMGVPSQVAKWNESQPPRSACTQAGKWRSGTVTPSNPDLSIMM